MQQPSSTQADKNRREWVGGGGLSFIKSISINTRNGKKKKKGNEGKLKMNSLIWKRNSESALDVTLVYDCCFFLSKIDKTIQNLFLYKLSETNIKNLY